MDARGYMKRLSILCLVMALFGTAVMLVGYKAPTIGLVATVAALVIAAAALGWKARERANAETRQPIRQLLKGGDGNRFPSPPFACPGFVRFRCTAYAGRVDSPANF